MKINTKGLLWGGIGIVVLVAGIWCLTKCMDPEYSYRKNKEFMEDSEIYDVLFFGNSHMANGVYPMELWHDYGLVSYNLGGFGNLLPATYWMMSAAVDRADPALVVIDCHNLRSDGKMGQKEMLHSQIDCLPLNRKKLQMINDLVEDPKDRLEFIWDFVVYHDRWWDLDQADFEKEINIQKGAEIAFDVVPPNEMAQKPQEAPAMETMGDIYLRRMIEECRSRNIEVLLTYLPFPAQGEDWKESMYVESLAEEYGVPYLNFLDLQVVNLEVDCSDKSSHLNGSGARKVTAYIGQYIEEHYNIADHRGEETYAQWEEDYKRYTDYKIGVMENLETLDKYLMMLADPAFDCCIYVDGRADIWRQNGMYMPLIENVAGEKAKRQQEAADLGKDYFLVVDNQSGVLFEALEGEDLSEECSFGEVRCQSDGAGKGTVFLEEGSYTVQQENGAAVEIIVINNADGRIANIKRFDSGLSVDVE